MKHNFSGCFCESICPPLQMLQQMHLESFLECFVCVYYIADTVYLVKRDVHFEK